VKGYLKAILVGSYVWLVFVFLLIFLAAVPAIPGSLLIKLPASDDWTYSQSGDIVNLTANVSVYNGGFFTMENFFFIIAISSNNGSLIAEFESPPVNLPPGPWTTFPVYFTFNESVTSTGEFQKMFFSTVNYNGLVYFNADYLLDFKIQLGLNATVSAGPMVRDFQPDVKNATIEQVGELYLMDIPYTVNSTRALTNTNLYVNGTMSNDTEKLGSFQTQVEMGKLAHGNLTMLLSQDAYLHLRSSPDTLTFNCTFNFVKGEWTQDFVVQWVPPSPATSVAAEVLTAAPDAGGCGR
jgi:hypothetical protein